MASLLTRLLRPLGLLALAAPALVVSASARADELDWLDAYDVAWTSQSKNSADSMPCGGGDTGLNVWVENGDLLVYAQRSGCFDENNQYLKLGRLRVRLDPNPFAPASPGAPAPAFKQRLRLRDGRVEIEGATGAGSARILVWADVFNPAIHVEIDSSAPVSVRAAYETWRHTDLDLPNSPARPRFAALGLDGYPGQITRFRDEIAFQGDAVFFHRRNRDDRLLFDYTVRQQGLEAVKDQLADTQRGRTFGGILRGPGFRPAGTSEGKYILTPFQAWTLASEAPSRSHRLELVSHVAQTATLDAWIAGLRAHLAALPPIDAARQASVDWWRAFWSRSHIVINPGQPDPASRPWQIARNYQLFRYQLGTNVRGDYPTKFNGGNFTFDPSLVDGGRTLDPDWRAWGGGSFTAQNQRLVHWPMLKSGDADLVAPQLEFYRRALPSAVARVKTYYGHEGALFAEQLENFGLPISAGWGWTEPGANVRLRGKEVPFGDPRIKGINGPGPDTIVERGEQANAYVSYHYESQLEMSYLALERHRFSGSDLTPYLPLIRQSVRFFDEHYQLRQKMRDGRPLDANGRLVIFPSTACETYRGARNPSDVIAGLAACLDGLVALDDTLVPPAEKDYYRGFKSRLPDLPFGETKGDRILRPAHSWNHVQNFECPQFYPLFPFNRFSLADPAMIQIFRDTWKHGTFRKDLVQSWHQNGIFFARMGLAAEAADFNARKLANAPRRFPTFWGPGHDWVPDHNWGGSGMIGLQEMLLQTVGDELRILPAWPKEWDVDFKLHAPRQTVVELSYRSGKIERLVVTPASRRSDLILPDHQP
ncbi:MAG: hypothetical protein RLZZ50_1489 [Verrucomicrobiota bacterium]